MVLLTQGSQPAAALNCSGRPGLPPSPPPTASLLSCRPNPSSARARCPKVPLLLLGREMFTILFVNLSQLGFAFYLSVKVQQPHSPWAFP